MKSDSNTREEAEAATKEAMDMLGYEMTKHVGVVYDTAYKAGIEKGRQEMIYLLESIAANQNNQRLTDFEFREFVGRIAGQFQPR